MMKSQTKSCLILLFLVGVGSLAAGCSSSLKSSSDNQSQTRGSGYTETCTVSFDLYHYDKPFANKWVAIFPVVGGKISTSADNLGSGQTDAAGHATIDFKCSKSPGEYVLLWEAKKDKCCTMLRHQGQALTFSCGDGGTKCNAGKIVFEVFEFSSGG